MSRKHAALQRRVARVLGGWKDPHHDRPYPEMEIVQQVNIAEDGEVNLTVKPTRPHCPCCLMDLDDLQDEMESKQPRVVCFLVSVEYFDYFSHAINL